VLVKKKLNGKWILEGSPSNVQASFEKKYEPSKWITLKALVSLKGKE